MRGITFIDLSNETLKWHTADDWGLVMTSKVIGRPPIKDKYIELKDRDGDLDFTDALTGIPAYGTRTLSFDFEYLDDPKRWTEIFADICNALHGRRLKIFEPDDSAYYYLGRVSVGEPSGGLVKSFPITVKADTWKIKVKESSFVTSNIETLHGKTLVIQNNGRKTVSPIVITTADASFTVDNVTYAVEAAGTYQFPRLRFAPGRNLVSIVSGSGELRFRFQEGAM